MVGCVYPALDTGCTALLNQTEHKHVSVV